MKFIRFTHIYLLLIATAFFAVACQDSPNDENAVQQSIDTLLSELQTATSGNNVEGLKSVIASANRIKPISQSQTQSKNLLLSTANEKLAQLKFQTLLAESTSMSLVFQLAENQAMQVSLLRKAADSFSQSGTQDSSQKSQEILQSWKSRLGLLQQLTQLYDEELEQQDLQSTASRDEAEQFREEADRLLIEAEDRGIVDGHAAYKSGARALRKSQQVNLAAAKIELQTQMHTKPLLNDARAELEAIASILNGMAHTEDLLQQLLDKTNQSASEFRELADEIDAQTASTMNEAIAVGDSIIAQWDELSTLVQNAMKGTGRTRGTSEETQQTAGIWKLDLEWTLGQVQEAKRIFLMEEARTLYAMIEHGIVTTSSKWQELSSSVNAEIEQTTINAISAYENAKQLASSAGSQGEAFIHQLETRIAILQGEEVQIPTTPTTPTTTPSDSSIPTSGFASPQALVNAFNNATDIAAFDGTSPVQNLNLFYKVEGSDSEQILTHLNDVLQASGNILIAIHNKMGADAVTAFIASNPSPNSPMMTIDPTSIVLVGEDAATAREVSGRPVTLRLTVQGWKIIMSSKQDPEVAMGISMMMEMMGPLIEVMNTVTQQINDGQITSVDQINDAMQSAMENMNPF